MENIKLERDIKLTTDCGGEFILPDYLPAVRRLLAVECTPLPEDAYIRDAGGSISAEMSGDAVFSVTWQGEETGEIVTASYRTDYDFTIPLGTPSPPLRTRFETVPENVWCRVTGPRKLQLRCRLGTHMILLTSSELTPPEGIASAGVECARSDTDAASVYIGGARELTASVPLRGDAHSASPTGGGVIIEEISIASPTECRIRGKIMLRSGDFTQFDEYAALEAALPDGDVAGIRADGRITSYEAVTTESGDGIDVTFTLSCEVIMNRKCPIITDAYSTVAETALTIHDVNLLRPSAVICRSSTQSFTSAEKDASAIISCRASLPVFTAADGRLHAEGTLTLSALRVDGDVCSADELTMPYSFDEPADISSASTPVYWGTATPISASIAPDGTVTVELQLSFTVCEQFTSSAVKDFTVGEKLPPKRGVTVYYPAQNEAAWDIAKKFHVPAEKIKREKNVMLI